MAGTAVPVDMVVADAEAAASNEYLKVTSDGNAWQLLEQFQAVNLRATLSNSDKTLELHGNGTTTFGTVLAVSTGVTNFDFEIVGGGVSAAALGVFLPSDYGDAPASFNDAGHYIRQSFTGGLPGATKVYDPVSTAFTSFATISDAPTVYLGPIKPDADPGTQNAAPNATNALGDDLNNTDDEDGVASFPPLTRASTSYSVSATAYNTSGGSATLWGWVDFDGNGQFAASEVASAAVANGANPASVTLSWPAVTVTPAAGSTVYARLRLTTGTLTDNGATPQDERAQGGAADGEVEDYAITIPTDPIKDSFIGCGVITFDSDAQGFRTASTREDRTVNQGPFDAPYGPVDGTKYFRWESTGGNPSGHLRADDLDGEYQEVWTPAFTDPDFSALIGQQIQFDYKNDTGYNQYRLYIAIVGTNGNQYYYYFNNQLGAVGSWSRVKVPMVASAWHTGFEAGENPSTPPDSPAPSAIDFAAVLGNLGRFAVSVEGVSGPDTSRFDNFGRACDYGDLPESGTSFVTTGANAARHNIADEVRLGALIDSEPDGQPNATADGDDNAFSDDEDSVASFPPLSGATTSYAVTLSARNTSGASATLWGWVDFNNDGQFSAAEVASTSVANGANPANVTLTWSSVSVTVPVGAKAYARFRITTDSLTDNGATPQDERAQGRASDGEVEDYAITVIGDYGDAPASYGDPSHSIPSQGSYLGATQPDSESGSQHTANAQGDDLNGVPDDEDGVSSFPPLNTTSTSYSVNVLANNPSGTAATLYGWVDFDDNGRFGAGEAALAAVPAGTVNGTITLNWSGITVDPAAVGTAYARFRITTASLVDDPGTGQRDERAESAASNGEVEDYRIRTLDFGDAPNDLSSIDASLTNAYRTTLARNGPRHIVDIAIRLGALIDGEADGQPNLAADGDDTNTVDDEDGVVFNPALGISTANVILSGVANRLVATASTAGYLNAWIDYNQNGNFTDAGEQLFNDYLVRAGTNTLIFTPPNTAPHGTTYMRFRYSTQTGQANTVTGQAPDGEVEDYKVEVALPAPTTCAAGLVNGSFEAPVVGVTPPTPIDGGAGYAIYRAADVPGWGFRAASPSAATNFDSATPSRFGPTGILVCLPIRATSLLKSMGSRAATSTRTC